MAVMGDLRERLVDAYGEGEPVLAEDVLRLYPGISRQAVYKKIDAAIGAGELERYGRGVYYVPRRMRLGKARPSAESVLRRRWLVDADGNAVGYVTGAALANEAGLTEQVPAVVDPAVAEGGLDARLVSCAGDASANVPTRVIAVQLCGARRLAAARPALEAILADPKTGTVLKLAARRALSAIYPQT